MDDPQFPPQFPPPPPPQGGQMFHAYGAAPAFQPYAPPAAYAPQQRQAGTLPGAAIALYTPWQVAGATFLGSSLGGSILVAINEHRLGRTGAAAIAVIAGLVITVALVALAILAPDAPLSRFSFLFIVGFRVLAQTRQGGLVAQHLGAGGKKGSNWAVVGIGVASLVAFLLPIFVITFIQEMLKDPGGE